MTVLIGKYLFAGPYSDSSYVQSKPGVFLILSGSETEPYLIDVDESDDMSGKVKGHPRQACWQEKAGGSYQFAVFHTPHLDADERRQVVADIRSEFVVACG
ncbi:MAG TPA: hypothetical protein ENJ29_11300 [Bacteroidetes bacterium]|nr:hypothetical protein [Bacteroidota bacterium]